MSQGKRKKREKAPKDTAAAAGDAEAEQAEQTEEAGEDAVAPEAVTEEVPEAAPDAAPDAVDADPDETELIELLDPLEAARAEAAELKDKLLRALAETENVRRRAQRDREDASTYAIANFAREMLKVADNLRRALDSIGDEARGANESVESLVVGIEMTEREMLNAFERVGIKPIEALGQRYDHNLHEAMFDVDDATRPTGTVVEVLEGGYMLRERLLRPAKVGISKGGPGAVEATEPIDEDAPPSSTQSTTAYEKRPEEGGPRRLETGRETLVGGVARLLPGGRWEKKFTAGVVLAVAPFGAVLAFHGVAVDATVRTGVVGADVARGDAGARLAVRFCLGGNGASRHVAEAPCVDALGLADEGPAGAVVDQLGLAAQGESHPVGGGGIDDRDEEVAFFAGRGIVPREAEGACRPIHVASGLAVDLSEGDHHLIDHPGEGLSNLGKIATVPFGRRQRRGDHRIVTPYRHPRPKSGADTVQLVDGEAAPDGR